MRNHIGMAAVAGMACLTLAGCGDKAPTGQVVATVGKDEVTAIDLRNEMNGFTAPNAEVRKRAEAQALQQIISRKLIAKAAEEAGVAKTPEFAQQKERVEEALLAQAWQSQIAKQVPPPSKVEIDRYIAEHPNTYAQRKVFEVDQVRMARPADQTLIRQLEPLKTLEEIVAVLDSRGIRYERAPSRFDALAVQPQIIDQIAKLPVGEVFIIPTGNLLVISGLRNILVEPVPNDVAVKHATQILTTTRTEEALRRQFGGVVQAGLKDVKYSKAYEPPAAAKAAAPAATPAPAPAKK